jgi:hypothetical protein
MRSRSYSVEAKIMASNMIRAILPFHLRTRAHVGSEVTLEVADLKPGPVTQPSVLEVRYQTWRTLRQPPS